jgi:hypothetical protein
VNLSGETIMVALAVVTVLVLLGVVFFRWFRGTPMYRANRASGVVPGQWSAFTAQRAHGVGEHRHRGPRE